MTRLGLLCAAALSWGVLAGVAAAQEGGRIAKLRESGTIVMGYPETSPPFAYLDADQQPIGYSVEICRRAIDRLKATLGLPDLAVRTAPTTSATRILLIANGTIDIECGNATNTVERHKLVGFAPTTFVAQVVLVARKEAGVDVNDPASFRGKSIAAQAGGQTFKIISQLNAREHYDIRTLAAKDTGEAFLMLETGRAQGTINDDGLAYGAVASSKRPEDYVVGTKSLELAPYGILEPKDDPAFKHAFDAAVTGLITDGTVATLYAKYFTAPLPSKGINLHFPMSPALARALKTPTDSGDPAAYQ